MASNKKIAFIQAQWHGEMTQAALKGFEEDFDNARAVEVFPVPGALEMPLKAQQLARTGNYDAIICCAFVVNGGIYAHEYVAQAVLDGIMRVNLDEGVPVLSVSLTPHHYHESKDHRVFFRKHMVKKGAEASDAVKMLLGIASQPKSGEVSKD